MINVNLQKMYDLIGGVSSISSEEVSGEIRILLDSASKKKLDAILSTGRITASTQTLCIDELIMSKEDEKFLTKGQSPFIQNGNVFSITTQPRTIPHFKAVFTTLAPMKTNADVICAIEICIQNFAFDFQNSRKTISDTEIIYENVQMKVYYGNHTVRTLGD